MYKAYKDLPHFITTKLASMDTQRMEQDMNRTIEYSKKYNLYYIINQDYQNYKKRFNKGLNFRVFSKDKTNDKIHKGFYVLKVPEDKATQTYFKVELWMLSLALFTFISSITLVCYSIYAIKNKEF